MGSIVLIDDDGDDLEILISAFYDIDPTLNCVTFSDCTLAISHLKDDASPQPACIFIDLFLPKINGRECLELIRAIPKLSGVPIAMMSGTVRETDVKTLTDRGADFFFNKSHKAEDYYEIIRTVIAKISSLRIVGPN